MMENLKNNNIKSEQVCRTCLIDEGHFFNISDTFDHYTLTQMIQNITNLQIHPTDGYTNSICEYCVKEVRRAYKFRTKCLESYNTLTSVVPISVCKAELPIVEEIKKEMNESCDSINTEDDHKSDVPDVESDYDNVEDSCIVFKKNPKHSPIHIYQNKLIIFECPLCHGIFNSTNVYQKHINELHPDRINDECFKKEPQPLGYILKKRHLDKTKYLYKCSLDEFTGNTFVEFRNHMIEHTGEKSVLCIDCGFRTTKINLLKAHRLQKHVEEKKFSCTLCSYSCKTPKSLTNHMNSHSNEKNYKCKLCPMTFKYPTGLSVHKMKIHENKKSHVCEICQKAYYKKETLKKHMYTHTGERPHVCHYCGRAFVRMENMKTHVALQHEPLKYLYKCDICGYSTKQKCSLKTHIQKHNGEKRFFCPQCPFSSLFQYMLKAHMIRHLGLKNFSCDLCDYKAVSADDVKKHRIKHTGEKPFQCSICEYRGGTKRALSRHLQTHSTEQKFECPNCPYKTNVKDTLTKHMRRNCVILKRGRRPSKPHNIPETADFKEDISFGDE